MAIKHIARATSLAYNDGGAQTISDIQSYDYSHSKELAEFLKGTSRVTTHYAGKETAAITVETSNVLAWNAATVGTRVTDVVLTIEGALDSGDTADGDDITITLSHAVISEKGNLSMGNENSAPVVGSITFTLSRDPAGVADPTYTIASGA